MVNEKEYTWKVSAAGRVNIIGEHVDYCGGKVFPAALSMRNTVYVRPNGTNTIRLRWTTLPDEVTLDLNALEKYRDIPYGNYQAGSALLWRNAGHKLVGCDMVQDCTVPFGSGLSSSAAIEVSTIAALATAAGEKIDPVEIALTAQKAEREYAGVNCGIMDQYASACGKKGHAMLLDCKTLSCEYVPVALGDCVFVIANCNKPHSLADSKYNERRAETDEALATLQQAADISCLADLTPQTFAQCGYLLSGKIYDRARHVVEECDRVRKAEQAMKSGDTALLGQLLNASHASLRDLYEVTGKELDALAAAAQSHPACLGSRMTGGGFGGCTISLVQKEGVKDFIAYVGKKYEASTYFSASFYDTDIADGIVVEKL
ncbi:MAG: galactokinase [Clostridia bacterium]|nr:galactokinase [Clostridia bacterium]